MQLTSYLCQKLALPLIRISDCSYILISFDRKNRKIAFFTFFEGLKNGPFKEKNVPNFLDPLATHPPLPLKK